MNRIMVDIETLGQTPGSVILAIGAVRFDDVQILDEFYVNVNPESCVAAGLHMDVSTVMWWLQQSDEARKSLVAGEAKVLQEALLAFGSWAIRAGTPEMEQVQEMWGNGSDFDNVLLTHAFASAGLPLPWPFWANRCYRTLKSLRKDIPFQKPAIAHNALEDARAQALHLVKLRIALGGGTEMPSVAERVQAGQEILHHSV